jgi:hypothetical protein
MNNEMTASFKHEHLKILESKDQNRSALNIEDLDQS